jgi:hypothetical protein
LLTFQVLDANSLHDLKNLCEVSTDLHPVSLPYLYQRIVLRLRCWDAELEDLDVEALRPALDGGHLSHTRDLVITSEVHKMLNA